MKTFLATTVDDEGIERVAMFDMGIPQEVIDFDVTGLFLHAAQGSLTKAQKNGTKVVKFTLELVDFADPTPN